MKKRTCAHCGATLTKRNTADGEENKCRPCRSRERERWWLQHPEEFQMLSLAQAFDPELRAKQKR